MTPTLDPYVLGLAVSAAPCFGYHERGNATCGDCPVASRCVEARAMRAVTVAGQLEKATRAAARAAKAPKPAPAVSTSAPSGESIDDILASIERIPTNAATVASAPVLPVDPSGIDDLTSLFGDLLAPPSEPVAPPAPVDPAPVAPSGPRVTPMKAVIDSVCFVCNGRIPAKSHAEFLPGKGLRHTTCPSIGST